jgi:hypothetical protein
VGLGIIGGSSFGSSSPPRPAINEDTPLTALPLLHDGHPIRTGNGVVLCARATVENCTIQNFHYDGVHIETIDTLGQFVQETGAPYTGQPSGLNATTKNANVWQIRNCFIYGNGRHGIFSAGDDSNGGVAIAGTLQNNAGWAVYDRSSFGNNYFGMTAEANGHFVTDVRALINDAVTPGAPYAGTADGGVFKSGDQTRSWAAANRGLLDFESIPTVQALAIEPRGPYNTLYLGTKAARLIDQNSPDPQNPYLRVVLQSKDAGATWLDAGTSRNGLTSNEVTALAVHVSSSGVHTLYAATADKGVFQGTFTPTDALDKPDTFVWTPINQGLLAKHPLQALVVQAGTSPAVLYAGGKGGVFKKNGGAAWVHTLATGNVQALAIDSSAPNNVYAATHDAGIYKSSDFGNTWEQRNTGLVGKDVHALLIDSATPTVLYAGTGERGIFKSADGAASWTRVLTGDKVPASAIVQALAIDAADPTILYAGTNVGLFTGTQPEGDWRPFHPFYGGSYKSTGRNAASVFVGCYAEGDQVYGSELAYPTLLLGGVNGGGFNFNTDGGLIATTAGSGQGVLNLPIRSPVLQHVRTLLGAGQSSPVAVAVTDSVIFVDAGSQEAQVQLPYISKGNNHIPGQQFTIKRIDSNVNHLAFWRSPDALVDGQAVGTFFFLVPAAQVDYAQKKFSSVTLVAGEGDWKVISQG